MTASPTTALLPAPRRWLVQDIWAIRGTTALLLLAFCVFVLYPLAEIVVRSVWTARGPGLEHYAEFLREPKLSRTLANSLLVSTVSTVLTVSVAFGYAYVLTRTTLWGRPILWA